MPPKKTSAKLAKAAASKSPKFPKTTLEKALQIPFAIKDKNGGNPWEPEEIRQAVAVSQGNTWYSQTAASRDYGLTSGTRDVPPISLTELGREIVYAPNRDGARAKEASVSKYRHFQEDPRILQGQQSARHEISRKRAHEAIRARS